MRRPKNIEQGSTFCKDFVLDNINYHIEYNTASEALFLYIPQAVIICKASELDFTYPEILHLDFGLLYPGILDFIVSDKSVKSIGTGTNKRLMLEPISFVENVYYIAYERDTDYLFLQIPARRIYTDILTINVVHPDITVMHEGVLLSVIKDYVDNCR